MGANQAKTSQNQQHIRPLQCLPPPHQVGNIPGGRGRGNVNGPLPHLFHPNPLEIEAQANRIMSRQAKDSLYGHHQQVPTTNKQQPTRNSDNLKRSNDHCNNRTSKQQHSNSKVNFDDDAIRRNDFNQQQQQDNLSNNNSNCDNTFRSRHFFNNSKVNAESIDILLPTNPSSHFNLPLDSSLKSLNKASNNHHTMSSTFDSQQQHNSSTTNSNESSLNSFVVAPSSGKLRKLYNNGLNSNSTTTNSSNSNNISTNTNCNKQQLAATNYYNQELGSYQSSDCDNDSPNSENDYEIDASVDSSLYVALYDFKSGGETQMSLYKGQIINVTATSETGEWCEAMSKNGNIGWVPTNRITPVSLFRQPWFHGPISRDTAEWLLSSGINGSFLVRDSYTHPGSRSISLRFDARVYHYRIKEELGRFFITPEYTFGTLSELIHHYSLNANNLTTFLLYPAPRLIDQNAILNNQSPTNIDAWEINKDHLLMNKQIGVGQWGVVYNAIWKKHNIRVAVKTLKEEMMDKEFLDEFLEEAEIMKSLRHPNLIQLLGVCTREAPVYIITEFMSEGNLLDYLRNCDRIEINGFTLMYMATQICAAMAYLESRNYVHRDLAARNCLVGGNHLVKVADFGLTRLVKRDEVYVAHVGAKFPIKWTAVEGLAHNRFTSKSDVWSFGVVLWELATYGMTPYPGVELSDVYCTLSTGYRMARPAGCPEKVYAMMRCCWAWEASERPTFAQLHDQIQTLLLNPNIFDIIEDQEAIDKEQICKLDKQQHQQANGNGNRNDNSSIDNNNSVNRSIDLREPLSPAKLNPLLTSHNSNSNNIKNGNSFKESPINNQQKQDADSILVDIGRQFSEAQFAPLLDFESNPRVDLSSLNNVNNSSHHQNRQQQATAVNRQVKQSQLQQVNAVNCIAARKTESTDKKSLTAAPKVAPAPPKRSSSYRDSTTNIYESDTSLNGTSSNSSSLNINNNNLRSLVDTKKSPIVARSVESKRKVSLPDKQTTENSIDGLDKIIDSLNHVNVSKQQTTNSISERMTSFELAKASLEEATKSIAANPLKPLPVVRLRRKLIDSSAATNS